ncbi:sigma-70 family RNA polymerase sigma factor [Vibrio sp. SCSIO 43136]|uniref:sigma-70 family RNA polymerase sigma factor n=1 Tax=Vibrio sp. SCSIO 43136 TaxID=2819101 RepID=UPI0020752166|nr:sigma-70 family RNA polymerase sigma factor [Vibrio sp. SCSIO 43136]USD67771.1 sigma-70 family RNA polymerase sigma factor [Vibrio sp. SCSIO 43136]
MNIESVWLTYQTNLRAFLSSKLESPADVDDVLQEVLIKTYQNLDQLKDSAKLKSWLFQIANHALMDHFRNQKPSDELSDFHTEEPVTLATIDQLTDCVIPFIEALPEQDANLLKAIEISGVSQKQYALENNIKYSTLKSRVKKSRQTLHQLFNQCCSFSVDHQGNLSDITPKKSKCAGC